MSELQTKFINNTDSAQTTDHPPIQSVLSSQQCGLGNQHIIQRWQLGTAPAPHGWNIVTDPEHLRRLQQAENHVRNLLTSRNCRNYFRDNCTNGAGANALQQAFDNAKVYLMLADNNTLGASDTSNNIAFNLRTFRIGHWMMASTLLHEMFHTCDPNFDIQDELDAENAIETCRLHTPWIDNVSPSQGAIGSNVTITGFSFGPTRDPAVDEVHIGGVPAPVISWNFAALGSDSSLETIVVTVPNGAAGRSGIVVINNRVRSNIGRFTVV
jgi:hypothetical protein